VVGLSGRFVFVTPAERILKVTRIKFRCSNCTNVLKVSEHHAGKAGTCPVCGHKVQIPTLEEYKKRRKHRLARSKRCPRCDKRIRRDATTCRHCGWGEKEARELAQLEALDALIDAAEEPKPLPKRRGILKFFHRRRSRL